MQGEDNDKEIIGIQTDAHPLQRRIVRVIRRPEALVDLGSILLLPSLYLGEVVRAVGMTWDHVRLELKGITAGPPSVILEIPRRWTKMAVPDDAPSLELKMEYTSALTQRVGTTMLPDKIRSCIHKYGFIRALTIDTSFYPDELVGPTNTILSPPADTLRRGKFIHIPPAYLGTIARINSGGIYEAIITIKSVTAGAPTITLRADRRWTELGGYPKPKLEFEWRQVSFV